MRNTLIRFGVSVCHGSALRKQNYQSTGKIKTERFNLLIPFSIIILSLLNISCVHKHKHIKKESMALISPVNNSKVQGWVRLKKIDYGQTLVTAEIKGLAPNKKHGFHIHQYGDCRENGKHAGGHFNPYDNKHGSLYSEEKHEGDLGNLKSNNDGVAVYKKVMDICVYTASGRSVIIHANADDLISQPSGNSGPYIGCGILGYTRPAGPQKKIIIKKIGKFQFQVDRSQIDQYIYSIHHTLQEIKMEPYKEKGKIIGFRFKHIKSGSIYERLGFKESDTIMSINGEQPNSSLHLAKLLKQSKTRSKLDMTIKREEKEIVFSWSVKEDISVKIKPSSEQTGKSKEKTENKPAKTEKMKDKPTEKMKDKQKDKDKKLSVKPAKTEKMKDKPTEKMKDKQKDKDKKLSVKTAKTEKMKDKPAEKMKDKQKDKDKKLSVKTAKTEKMKDKPTEKMKDKPAEKMKDKPAEKMKDKPTELQKDK